MSELQEAVKTENDILNAELAADIEMISGSIEKGAKDIDIEVSLEKFETYLLPFLIGTIESNDTNRALFYNNVRHLTEGKNLPLYIIDHTGIKYKLPPLSSRLDTDFDATIVSKMANAEIENHDPRPSQYFTKNIKELADSLEMDEGSVNEYKQNLIQIYTDYSYLIPDKEITKDIPEDCDDDLFDLM